MAVGLLLVQAALALTGVWLNQHDQQLVVIVGGSMEPAYAVGDAVVLDKSPQALRKGDIVTFHSGESLTTHRIIDFHTINGTRYLQTQGDANPTPDADLTPLDAVVGEPIAHVEGGGYVFDALTSRWGRLLTFGPALALIIISELRHVLTTWREPEAGTTGTTPNLQPTTP